MIDLTFVLQCIKRRWWMMAAVCVACALVGGAWSFVAQTKEEASLLYTAEATIYMNGYDESDINEYNYSVDESYLVSDARRIVVSDSVAGEVRRAFGDGVIISSPFWKNPETKATFYTHFIFVDASAESKEVALEAADMAANLAVEKMREQISVTDARVYEPAVLKAEKGKAADFGVDAIGPDVSSVGVESKVSLKTVAVSAFCGLFLSFLVILAYYYFNRRFRSPHDVERLLGVPVLACVEESALDAETRLGSAPVVIDEVCSRNDIQAIAVYGMPQNAATVKLAERLKEDLTGLSVSGVLDLSSSERAFALLQTVGGVVLSIVQNEASSREIEEAARFLNLVEVPVVGAVYLIPTKSRR